MKKLKKGWQNIVVIGTLLSLALSYTLIAFIYRFIAEEEMELVDALMQPVNIYNAITADENLVVIVPFIPILLIAVTLYMLRKNIFDLEYEDASEFGVKGTAKWGTVESVLDGKTLSNKSSFSKKDFKTGLKMEEGIVVGKSPNKNKALIIHDKTNLDNKNVFISGSSGSGKGQSYVLPNLVNIRNEGIIVIDPKGENYEYTHQLKRDQGYKVYNIDFANFSESKYNPLDYVQNDEDAKKISEIITKNSAEDIKMDFFTERAQSLLAALISYVKSEYPREQANMEKVIDVFNHYVSDPDTCDEWMANMPNEHPAKGLLLGVLGELGSPNTRSSVTSSFQSIISIFQLSRVKEMTRTSDFLFDDFQKEKSILYVKISVPTNPFKSLTSVFFVQMIDRFFDLGDQDPLSRLKIPVHFILDEFPNIGKIEGYQETLALCRGYRMSMHTIIQDISQLEQRNMYGKETTRSIVSNHSAKLILKVGEPETAKYWSKWFGETTVKYKNESSSYGRQGKSTNVSDVYDKRSLLPDNELMKMDDNEAYLLMVGEHPLKIEKAWQFVVYPDLLSDKDRNLNYNKVRHKIGFTDKPMSESVGISTKVSIFEQYQSEKEKMKLNTEIASTVENVVKQSDLTEEEIKKINTEEKTEEKPEESKKTDTLDEIEEEVDDHIKTGNDLTNMSIDDLMDNLADS